MVNFYIVGRVFNFLGSVLPQQKFEATDRPVIQLCVTAQFYLSSKGKDILSRRESRSTPKTQREETPQAQFWLLFLYVFPPPLSLPYVNWNTWDGCFNWGPHSCPWTFLCFIFVGFCLLCLLATTILDSFFLF